MKQNLNRDDERGFTLVESLVAMLIFIIATLALAVLMLYGMRLHSLARDGNMAIALAKAKVEDLRIRPLTDPQRSVGGDLQSNASNHFDTPAGTNFVRRWAVAAGPLGTQDVAVTVVSSHANVKIPAIQVHALIPQ